MPGRLRHQYARSTRNHLIGKRISREAAEQRHLSPER
jgi:hypothetical protein